MAMRTRIKICGLTSAEDAAAAVAAGADALGFVFHSSSPRAVVAEQARDVIATLPPFVSRIGLFVNASPEVIRHTAQVAGLDAIQLHGDEPPDFCDQFHLPVLKAFRLRTRSSIDSLPNYRTAGWLLDSFVIGMPGGTGARFDWDWAREAGELGRPIIVAGGLTPDNVAEAILCARPYAVDVSSGVESTPGRKDRSKMNRFVEAVRGADARVAEARLG